MVFLPFVLDLCLQASMDLPKASHQVSQVLYLKATWDLLWVCHLTLLLWSVEVVSALLSKAVCQFV